LRYADSVYKSLGFIGFTRHVQTAARLRPHFGFRVRFEACDDVSGRTCRGDNIQRFQDRYARLVARIHCTGGEYFTASSELTLSRILMVLSLKSATSIKVLEVSKMRNFTTNVWLPVSVVVKKTFRPHRLDPPS
jgi:hypothetical protein